MYGDIGQKSNTMIFSEKPGDVNALLAQAAAVVTGGASVMVPQQGITKPIFPGSAEKK